MARAQRSKDRKHAPVPNKMTKKQMKRKKPIDESYLSNIKPLTDNQQKVFDEYEKGKPVSYTHLTLPTTPYV